MYRVRLTYSGIDVGTLTQTAADWVITSTTDILADNSNVLESSMNDSVNIYEYISKNKYDLKHKIYARYRAHLSDNSTTPWSRVTLVSKENTSYTLSNVMIVTPSVYVDITKYNVSTDMIKVTTTPFVLYSGSGNHDSTSWIVNRIGYINPVYTRDYDKDQLTELVIPNDILVDNSTYTISAIHHTDTGGSSQRGVIMFNTGIIDIKTNKRLKWAR